MTHRKKGDAMKHPISKRKIAAALKQEELGVPLEDIIRELGVSRETYLSWRRGYYVADGAGAGAGEQPPDSDIRIPRERR